MKPSYEQSRDAAFNAWVDERVNAMELKYKGQGWSDIEARDFAEQWASDNDYALQVEWGSEHGHFPYS